MKTGLCGMIRVGSRVIGICALALALAGPALAQHAEVFLDFEPFMLTTVDGEFKAEYTIYGWSHFDWKVKIETKGLTNVEKDSMSAFPDVFREKKTPHFEYEGEVTGKLENELEDGKVAIVATLYDTSGPMDRAVDRVTIKDTVHGWKSIVTLSVSTTSFKADNGEWTLKVKAKFICKTRWCAVPPGQITTRYNIRGNHAGGSFKESAISGHYCYIKSLEAKGWYIDPPPNNCEVSWSAFVELDNVGPLEFTINKDSMKIE